MRRLILLLIICIGGCRTAESQSDADTTGTVAIVNVTVIPMDSNRVLPGHTVLVRDGVVAARGPVDEVEIPDGALRIDGAGLYLMPGLMDAHVHLRDKTELLSYLAHGVTTVVHLSGSSGNVANVIDLRGRVARGEIPGPTILTSGRIIDGESPIFPGVSTAVGTPEQADSVVDAQRAAGVDVIKVYNNLRTDELRAVVRSADEHGIAVWGHVPRIDGRLPALERALSAGLDVIAHGEEVFFTMLHGEVDEQLDRGLAPAVERDRIMDAVRLIQQHGAAVIPNLSFIAMTRVQLHDIDRLWSDPEARYLTPDVVEMWREQNPTTRRDLSRFDLRERGKRAVVQRLTRALNDAGVLLLLGTDASAPGMFPGRSAHVELEELVIAGLTPFEALATGTRNAGRLLEQHGSNAAGRFGTIEVGSRADLVLLHDNPLADIANASDVAGVLVRGSWYPRAQLDAMRARQAAAVSR